MSRHDKTPPTQRIISPNHPSVIGAQQRLVEETEQWLQIDRWLQEDEKEIRREKRYVAFERAFASTMVVLILVLGVVLVAVNLWRLFA